MHTRDGSYLMLRGGLISGSQRTARHRVVHGVQPRSVTQPIAIRGGAPVALAGFHEGKGDPLPPLPALLARPRGGRAAHGRGSGCGRGQFWLLRLADLGGVRGDGVIGTARIGEGELWDGHSFTFLHLVRGFYGRGTFSEGSAAAS